MIIDHNGESYIKLADLYEAAVLPCIMAPFFGVPLPCIVRKLTYAQIRSCGDFSLIQTTRDIIQSENRTMTTEEMVDYSEMQHRIINKSLVHPTYDEIMSLGDYDVLRINAEKELDELELIIKAMPNGLQKNELTEQYYTVKMNSQYLLPADFVSFVMQFALDQDNSDIKDVSEEMLFEAAIRAKNGSGNPSDHLPGNFTEFNKVDVNNRSWIIYHQRTGKHGRAS